MMMLALLPGIGIQSMTNIGSGCSKPCGEGKILLKGVQLFLVWHLQP
jgi:hypothetical protein